MSVQVIERMAVIALKIIIKIRNTWVFIFYLLSIYY